MKPTQGPYRYQKQIASNIGGRIVNAKGQFIAECSDAHGALLAAAPEMLEALKSAVNYLDGFKGPFNHELLNLKSIIAKAVGND